MDRRHFVTTVGAGTITALSGCLGYELASSEELESKDDEIADLEAEISDLEADIDQYESEIETLESESSNGTPRSRISRTISNNTRRRSPR